MQVPVFCQVQLYMENQAGYMLFFPKEKEMGFLKVGRRQTDSSLACAWTPGFSQGKGWALQEFRWNVFHPKHPGHGMSCHVCREASPAAWGFYPSSKKIAESVRREA